MDASRKRRSRSPSPRGVAALLCPRCALPHSLEERLCVECGMPLVYAGASGAGGAQDPGQGDPAAQDAGAEARTYARKIRPELARGDLVRVAGGRNQAEAELIRNLLIEEGVPSMVRRSAGFDVPDFLAGGPRDVMVPRSGAEHALAALGSADLGAPAGAGPQAPTATRAARITAAVVGLGALGAALVWAALQLGP